MDDLLGLLLLTLPLLALGAGGAYWFWWRKTGRPHHHHHQHVVQPDIVHRLDELERSHDRLHKEAHNIESQLHHHIGHLKSSIDFLRDRLEGNLQRQIAHVESNVDYLRGDVHDVRRDVHDTEQQVGKLEVKSGVSTARIHGLEHEVGATAADVHRVGHEVQAAGARLQTDEHDISDLRHDVQELQHLEHGHDVASHLQHNVHRLEHDIDAEAAGLDRVGREVKATANRLHHDEHDISDLKRDVHELRHHQGHHESHHVAVGELRKQVHGLQHDVDAEAAGLHRVGHAIKATGERLSHDEGDISELKREVRDLQLDAQGHHSHGPHHQHDHLPHGHHHVAEHVAEWSDHARLELETAKLEVQKIMSASIDLETGCCHGETVGDEYPQRYHQLANDARHIFRDVRRYLPIEGIRSLEEASKSVDRRWNDLFRNSQSMQFARAYYDEVKYFCSKLDEVIAASLDANA